MEGHIGQEAVSPRCAASPGPPAGWEGLGEGVGSGATLLVQVALGVLPVSVFPVCQKWGPEALFKP